jgi:hypothetical protein
MHVSNFAASWLDDCIRNHDRCIRPSNPRLPTRVIDVGPSDGSVQPRLFETGGQRGKYLALSHCWGSSWRLVTTQQNIEELKTGIPLLTMAKVFRDAVVTTRRLGFRYLWVDSFCIIQNSDEDWTREAAKMADVYSNCYLTISARDSPNSNQRIFKDRPPVIWPIEIYSPSIGTPENPTVEFGIREDTDRIIGTPDSALAKRSWALQEYFLSTALLHYCDDQLRWDCESYEKMEDRDFDMDFFQQPFIKGLLPAGDIMKVGSPDGKPTADGHFVAWYKIVQQYSGKALSVKTDRLLAISALVKTFSRLSGADSVAGLWLEDLDRGLLWHRWERASTHPNVQTRRSPSWCWTSIDSRVFYHHLFGSSFEDYVYYIWATRIPSPGDCSIVDAFMSREKDHTRSGIYKGCIQLWALSRYVEVEQVRGAYAGPRRLHTSVGEPLPCVFDTEIPPAGKLRCIRLSNWRQEQPPFAERTIPGPLPVRGYYMVVERAEPTDIRRHPADMGSFRRVGIGSDLVENVDAFFRSDQKHFFKIC